MKTAARSTGLLRESGQNFCDSSPPEKKILQTVTNRAEAIEDPAICQLSLTEVERFLLSDPRIAVRISSHGFLGLEEQRGAKSPFRRRIA
jgi:hypothetical protein